MSARVAEDLGYYDDGEEVMFHGEEKEEEEAQRKRAREGAHPPLHARVRQCAIDSLMPRATEQFKGLSSEAVKRQRRLDQARKGTKRISRAFLNARSGAAVGPDSFKEEAMDVGDGGA